MDLKMKDVADLLNISETTIRRWLKQGKIPAYQLNRQYRFSRIEIENWMLKCKLKPLDEEPSEMPLSALNQPKESGAKNGTKQYSLYRAIHRGGVYHDIPGDTKEELISETMKVIAEKLGRDAEVLSELLLDREKLMPTALNHGVAVPHARDVLLELPYDVVTLVFPKEPLEYGALDQQPVHSLFFIFASEDKMHLHLLAKIAHLSSHKEALQLMRSRPEKNTFLEFVKQWESTIKHPE